MPRLFAGVLLTSLVAFLIACGGDRPPTPASSPPDPEASPSAGAGSTSAQAPPVPAVPATSAADEPDSAGEQIVTIFALSYATRDGVADGVVSKREVRVRPAASPGELRVFFGEEEVNGSGAMLQSAGWTAVLLGCMLEGHDPTDYEFSFTINGRADGPSAGALMTVGVLAALRGETVREDAAMTGTINPDGTIGPVGGIPHKIAGAAREGKTLVLVPAGQRFDRDENKGILVDVVQVGEELGIEVREVSTIFEAYELLTGNQLAPPLVAGNAPQLSQRAFELLKGKALEQLGRFERERSRLATFNPDVQAGLEDDLYRNEQLYLKADQSIQQGQMALGYDRAWRAAADMRRENAIAEIVNDFQNTGVLSNSLAYLRSSESVINELGAFAAQLQARQPQTVGDALAIMDAHSKLGIARGLIIDALQTSQGIEEALPEYAATPMEYLAWMSVPIGNYTLASEYIQQARDRIDSGFGLGLGTRETPDNNTVYRLAETLRRASGANLAAFESLYSSSDLQQELFALERTYRLASRTLNASEGLHDEAEKDKELAAQLFGYSQSSYTLSSLLIVKYYSLGAEVNESMNVVNFTNEKALSDMLEFADKRARELINAAGEDAPVAAVAYYEVARSLREGDPQSKLDALSNYWQAALLAQISSYLVAN